MVLTTEYRKKVLLVEDVDVNRYFYTFLIEEAGFSACSTDSAIDAISIIAASNEPFDFILMNFMLPDMRGDIVIRELAHGGYNVKTVALFTALDGDDPRVAALQKDVGALIDFHYVSKTLQCLKAFLHNPLVESIEPLYTTDMGLTRSRHFQDMSSQAKDAVR